MNGLKIAVVGSGSTYTPELIEGFINRRDTMPISRLALLDIDDRKLNIVGALAERMVSHAGLACDVILTKDYESALYGADFVFAQIRVGRLAARILDEKIPLKYDLIGQETTGIGGFFKALRTIPVLTGLAEHMKRLCPSAWLINFSNPSGICAQALLDHTGVKMMGLCNAPIGMMENPSKLFTAGPAEIDYVGLNHLSFVTGIRGEGRDFLREAVEGNDELLEKLDGQMGFSKEIIRIVGGIPNGYLRYFMFPRESLAKMKAAELSRGEECVAIEEDLLKLYSDANLYVKPELLSKRGGAKYSEVACSLAESIYTDNGGLHVVNTYNRGAIPYLADDDVVETIACVGADGPVTVASQESGGDYIRGIVRAVKAYERLTVKAAVEGSRDAAIAALLANPLIGDYGAATRCFDEMLEAHRAYLPQFN